MADDIDTTPGAGRTVATDEVGTRNFQLVKLVDGTAESTAAIAGSAARGLHVDPRPKVVRLAHTPAISSGAVYAAKDAIGGLLTFAAAVRSAGGTCWLEALQLVDKGQQMRDLELVLFDRAIAAPVDNAVFAPTDAELATCVGVVPIVAADYRDYSTNSVASLANLGLEIVLNGSDLFGVLVARGTPTYTSVGDLVVTLTLLQD